MARDTQRQRVYDSQRFMEVKPNKMRPHRILHIDATGPEPMHWTEKHPGEAMTIEQCQALVDKVLASKYVQRKYSPQFHSLPVYPTHAGGRASAGGGWHYVRAHDDYEWRGRHIRLGVWARQPIVVLHEIAHHLAGLSHGHDWRFCQVMLDLVRHFMGREAHDALKASFKEHRVRFTEPRKRGPVSPERRAQLVEQLAAARAAKADKADVEDTWKEL